MTANDEKNPLRNLPKIDELLASEHLLGLDKVIPHEMVLEAARDAVEAVRSALLEGHATCTDSDAIAQDARMRALNLMRPSLRPVINASGVVIHTNLGRSPLSEEAAKAAYEVARGYSTLEYSVDDMARGSRHDHCEQLICALTGAEAAIAVNNNAAAVMMVLNEFAAGHEAIVSRGEEVEIGGSFRIPDIMAQSKATMVEVGSTNKTHVSDYEQAITPATAMLLKVHTSNFLVVGFTESVQIKELRKLADAENARRAQGGELMVFEDLGSGCLVPLECFGAQAEPTVAEHLAQGADLVSFSGDKMLGGPQAGIIVGRKELIDRLKRNPLARAMRLDKMTLAALEVTLRQYLDGSRAFEEIPTLSMLTAPIELITKRAKNQMHRIAEAVHAGSCKLELVEETSRAGGGALPMCDIPTICVEVEPLIGDALSASRFLAQEWRTPVICRVKNEKLLFDPRTILGPEQGQEVADALAAYFAKAAE